MEFYEFTQNNTGGSFVTDNKLCHRVIIEASSENEADLIVWLRDFLRGFKLA